MVSYYNTLPYSQNRSPHANLGYSGQHWATWTPNYHTGPNPQFLGDIESTHPHHQMYYNPHHMFHPTAGASTDWHSPTTTALADNFAQNGAPATAHQIMQQHHAQQSLSANIAAGNSSASSSGSGSASNGPISSNAQMNESGNSLGEPHSQQQQPHITAGMPSPPITVSGSEISSPGVPASASSPQQMVQHLNSTGGSTNSSSPSSNNNNTTVPNNNNHTSPAKQQYFEWMKKPTYPAQPQPGKTRTKDKYRVVYTDFQRLELEKEYCTARYITIRRKSELAQALSLSERQVKIWFQNRRAKERKQTKKGNDPTIINGVPHTDYVF